MKGKLFCLLAAAAAAGVIAAVPVSAHGAHHQGYGNGAEVVHHDETHSGWEHRADGCWYYLNGEGGVTQGWIDEDGVRYYCGHDGRMCTGWVEDNGSWYHCGRDGKMQTGWVESDGSWYHCGHDGVMRTGWVEDNGRWYRCGRDGKMQTGWVEDNGCWYYCGSDGAMCRGWLSLNGADYYFDANGVMAAGGSYEINGKSYRFADSGELLEDWALTLVNGSHPLPDGFTVETVNVGGKPFDKRAAPALQALLDDARKAGYPMLMVSGYRTVDYQRGLVERSIQGRINRGMSREAAVAETALYVAAPGCSEHNLGLAADIVSSNWYSQNSGLESYFDQTPHYQWLSENAWKYGFILRYPKDKVSVTKIGYEPWHYRYVGAEAAEAIKNSGLTLEEYLDQ